MTSRLPPSIPSPPPAGSSRTVSPRTFVNSSVTEPYVPNKAIPVRAGAEDHKRHGTKGMPT